MAFIEDIIVSIVKGSVTVNQVGFGVPALAGLTGQRSILITGSGSSQLVAKSTPRQNVVSLAIVIGTGFAYAFAAGTVTIDLPTAGAKVRDLVADFNANAPSIVTDELTIEIPFGQTGAGAVVPISATPLTFTDFREISNIEQLRNFYDTTDPEHIMFTNILASVPTPRTTFLIDTFGAASITAALAANNTGVWYAILTTSTDEVDQLEVSDFANNNKRLALLVSDDKDRPNTVQGKRTAYLIHDAPDDHPEASWAAKALAADPGSITWKFIPNLQGQTANATATLQDLLDVRANKAQSYILNSGVRYVDEGQTVNPIEKTFIDQIRSRDWIEVNLAADLLVLSVEVPKIPYTNAGIAQVVQVITNRLVLAGLAGIIAPVENSNQAALSTDGKFRFNVQAPTRESVEAGSNPEDIDNRILNDVTFAYIEAGAIHEINITGRVILSEVG